MSNQWKSVDSGYNMAYGEAVEQVSKEVFLKNVDGKFQFLDYENLRVSPEFNFSKDAYYWYWEQIMTLIKKSAGQPPKAANLKKNPVTMKLPQWLIDWTSEQPESRAVLIEQALCKAHKLKPPDGV